MIIDFNEEEYSLVDFLVNDNIRQGVVNRNAEWEKRFFLYKLDEKDGATSVFHTKFYNERPDFILSIDSNNRFIIYLDNYNWSNLKEELKDLDYQIWETKELSNYINQEYFNKLRQKLEDNKGYIKEMFERYNNTFNETLKNYYYSVEQDYLQNPHMSNYKIYIDNLYIFQSNCLNELQNYLLDNSILDQIVDEKYNKIIDLENIYDDNISRLARVDAKNELLNSIKNNPSDFVKLSLKIKESIKDHSGKTMNIETKDDKIIKVNNRFNGYTFNTIKGYNNINIKNVKKITFGKKILFAI